jgi:hypothetical protein
MISANVYTYPRTLANLTLIILVSELLKISKITSSESENIEKDISEYSGIFYLLKLNFKINKLFNGYVLKWPRY